MFRWRSAGRPGLKGAGRVSEEFVSLSDVAPTFLEAAGVEPDPEMTARSLVGLFAGAELNAQESVRDHVLIGMERHDGCRAGGKGYPCRAIRTADFLYVINFEPGRWPAGDPDASVCARAIPYGEVDSSPTKQLLMDNAEDPGLQRFHDLAFGRRPAVELYDLERDPGQLENVAGDVEYAQVKRELRERLEGRLRETGDPRALGRDAPWDYYPYYGVRRNAEWRVDERLE